MDGDEDDSESESGGSSAEGARRMPGEDEAETVGSRGREPVEAGGEGTGEDSSESSSDDDAAGAGPGPREPRQAEEAEPAREEAAAEEIPVERQVLLKAQAKSKEHLLFYKPYNLIVTAAMQQKCVTHRLEGGC